MLFYTSTAFKVLPSFQPDYGYVWVMGLMDYQLL